MTCPFCYPQNDPDQTILLSNPHCFFLHKDQPVLVGSGVIVPRQHRATVFELTRDEWNATFELLQQVKAMLDRKYRPDGYNVGWNVGPVGGQEIGHAHLHVIPRFSDEPLSGRGIRFWLKQDNNRRVGP